MLGRGVKRKWSCLQELEVEVEVETLPAAAAAGKEKNEEDRQPDTGSFLIAASSKAEASHLQQQRQRVLGLCLQKLQHYQAGVELSLRRSVLLINTLRQIQADMHSDREEGRAASGPLLREDVALTCPGCADADGDDPPSSPQPPSQEADPPKAFPATAIGAFSDAVGAVGYLGDLALDDIFEDIDTSMYESSDLPLAWPSGPSWPVSVSLWTDEDVKVRSAGHGSGPGGGGGLQSCLMDLNELDHIMEILVNS